MTSIAIEAYSSAIGAGKKARKSSLLNSDRLATTETDSTVGTGGFNPRATKNASTLSRKGAPRVGRIHRAAARLAERLTSQLVVVGAIGKSAEDAIQRSGQQRIDEPRQ